MSFAKLLKISRPRFWFYTAGPFLLGYIVGLPTGYREIYPIRFWILFAYFLLPANLFLYGINDVFDRASDALNDKKSAQEHRLADQEQRGVIATLIIIMFISAGMLMLIPVALWWIFGLFLFFSVFYSAPPLRFKARPFLDSYSNVLYVLPGFLGYALTANRYPPLAIVVGAICWAAGMHAYSAIPDIEPDTQAGIRTVAVVLGKQRSLLFVAANWTIFALLIMATLGPLGAITLLYPAIPLALYFQPNINVARVYWWFPALNGLMGFLVFAYKTLLNS
ncbi:MAG: prenyltransferase [Chloroflexota bacterium]